VRPGATKEVIAHEEAMQRVPNVAARVRGMSSANTSRRDGAGVLGHLGGNRNSRSGCHAPVALHLRLVSSEAGVTRTHTRNVPRTPVGDHRWVTTVPSKLCRNPRISGDPKGASPKVQHEIPFRFASFKGAVVEKRVIPVG
jgi:hypothetical protein